MQNSLWQTWPIDSKKLCLIVNCTRNPLILNEQYQIKIYMKSLFIFIFFRYHFYIVLKCKPDNLLLLHMCLPPQRVRRRSPRSWSAWNGSVRQSEPAVCYIPTPSQRMSSWRSTWAAAAGRHAVVLLTLTLNTFLFVRHLIVWLGNPGIKDPKFSKNYLKGKFCYLSKI